MIFDADHFHDIRTLLQREEGREMHELELQLRPMTGGLEALAVTHVSARYRCEAGRPRTATFVMKQMGGATIREAHVYAMLKARGAEDFGPRVLGVHQWAGQSVLCLEMINPVSTWPWRDHTYTRHVLKLLARLHDSSVSDAAIPVPAWDYEAYIEQIACCTLDLLERSRRHPVLSELARRLPSLRRVVSALPSIRQQLLAWPEFGCTLIHGDVHPGNVLIQRRNGCDEPRLLDWSRTRLGSPLEDVSSWLQSLGYWEPEARRRHDTLLSHYLAARGSSQSLTSSVREGYWLAGASNALAGALLHHLQVALQGGEQQAAAIHSANDWLRIIRRADACWAGIRGLN